MVALEEKDSMRPVVIRPFKPELDSLMLSLSPKNLNILHIKHGSYAHAFSLNTT